MDKPIPRLSFALIAAALVAGCGERMPPSGGQDIGNQLTASDLALLTDFHAWKVRVPETQKPIKEIRLVIFNRRGGAAVAKFGTGYNLGTNCSSFLLGIRVEKGRFVGHLLTWNSDGGGAGWNLDFTDALADSYPAWTNPGTLAWNGNRAQLATSTKSNIFDNVLALEVEK